MTGTFMYSKWVDLLSWQFHEHGTYLVDSLWGVAGSELRDWETMTTLLLQGTGEELAKAVYAWQLEVHSLPGWAGADKPC